MLQQANWKTSFCRRKVTILEKSLLKIEFKSLGIEKCREFGSAISIASSFMENVNSRCSSLGLSRLILLFTHFRPRLIYWNKWAAVENAINKLKKSLMLLITKLVYCHKNYSLNNKYMTCAQNLTKNTTNCARIKPQKKFIGFSTTKF